MRIEPFESQGIRGANVIATLKGDSPEFVVVGAHHDTAPGATGAYDDAAGVGVMIEAARVLAAMPRPRTIVFASWDGEEAWSTGKTTTAGSRAYVKGLEARVARPGRRPGGGDVRLARGHAGRASHRLRRSAAAGRAWSSRPRG